MSLYHRPAHTQNKQFLLEKGEMPTALTTRLIVACALAALLFASITTSAASVASEHPTFMVSPSLLAGHDNALVLPGGNATNFIPSLSDDDRLPARDAPSLALLSPDNETILSEVPRSPDENGRDPSTGAGVFSPDEFYRRDLLLLDGRLLVDARQLLREFLSGHFLRSLSDEQIAAQKKLDAGAHALQYCLSLREYLSDRIPTRFVGTPPQLGWRSSRWFPEVRSGRRISRDRERAIRRADQRTVARKGSVVAAAPWSTIVVSLALCFSASTIAISLFVLAGLAYLMLTVFGCIEKNPGPAEVVLAVLAPGLKATVTKLMIGVFQGAFVLAVGSASLAQLSSEAARVMTNSSFANFSASITGAHSVNSSLFYGNSTNSTGVCRRGENCDGFCVFSSFFTAASWADLMIVLQDFFEGTWILAAGFSIASSCLLVLQRTVVPFVLALLPHFIVPYTIAAIVSAVTRTAFGLTMAYRLTAWAASFSFAANVTVGIAIYAVIAAACWSYDDFLKRWFTHDKNRERPGHLAAVVLLLVSLGNHVVGTARENAWDVWEIVSAPVANIVPALWGAVRQIGGALLRILKRLLPSGAAFNKMLALRTIYYPDEDRDHMIKRLDNGCRTIATRLDKWISAATTSSVAPATIPTLLARTAKSVIGNMVTTKNLSAESKEWMPMDLRCELGPIANMAGHFEVRVQSLVSFAKDPSVGITIRATNDVVAGSEHMLSAAQVAMISFAGQHSAFRARMDHNDWLRVKKAYDQQKQQRLTAGNLEQVPDATASTKKTPSEVSEGELRRAFAPSSQQQQQSDARSDTPIGGAAAAGSDARIAGAHSSTSTSGMGAYSENGCGSAAVCTMLRRVLPTIANFSIDGGCDFIKALVGRPDFAEREAADTLAVRLCVDGDATDVRQILSSIGDWPAGSMLYGAQDEDGNPVRSLVTVSQVIRIVEDKVVVSESDSENGVVVAYTHEPVQGTVCAAFIHNSASEDGAPHDDDHWTLATRDPAGDKWTHHDESSTAMTDAPATGPATTTSRRRTVFLVLDAANPLQSNAKVVIGGMPVYNGVHYTVALAAVAMALHRACTSIVFPFRVSDHVHFFRDAGRVAREGAAYVRRFTIDVRGMWNNPYVVMACALTSFRVDESNKVDLSHFLHIDYALKRPLRAVALFLVRAAGHFRGGAHGSCELITRCPADGNMRRHLQDDRIVDLDPAHPLLSTGHFMLESMWISFVLFIKEWKSPVSFVEIEHDDAPRKAVRKRAPETAPSEPISGDDFFFDEDTGQEWHSPNKMPSPQRRGEKVTDKGEFCITNEEHQMLGGATRQSAPPADTKCNVCQRTRADHEGAEHPQICYCAGASCDAVSFGKCGSKRGDLAWRCASCVAAILSSSKGADRERARAARQHKQARTEFQNEHTASRAVIATEEKDDRSVIATQFRAQAPAPPRYVPPAQRGPPTAPPPDPPAARTGTATSASTAAVRGGLPASNFVTAPPSHPVAPAPQHQHDPAHFLPSQGQVPSLAAIPTGQLIAEMVLAEPQQLAQRSDLANEGFTHSVREQHRRWCRGLQTWIRAHPTSLAARLEDCAVRYIHELGFTSGWQWQTLHRNMCSLVGAMNNLSLYSNIAASISFNTAAPLWRGALRTASLRSQQSKPHDQTAVSLEQVQIAVEEGS